MQTSPAGLLAIALALATSGCLDFKEKEYEADGGPVGANGGSHPEDGGGRPGDDSADASGGNTGGDSGSSTNDSGTSGPGGDSGTTGSSCTTDAECGDVEKFHCVANACVEYECHAERACTGLFICESHMCVPFVPPERFPTGYSQTSGGGSSSSSKYRLRASFGTPQPFGILSNSKYRMVLGPGAGRP